MDVADFFAGIGGFTEAAEQAGCRVKWAANHFRPAVDNHEINHPTVEHACQDLCQADWGIVPRVDLLCASPACTGYTPARGRDRPHHDAARGTAWAIVDFLEYQRVPAALIENVPAFAKWPLYRAWCFAVHSLGYAISPYISDAADHGVPQNRKRLFIALTRSKHPVQLQLPQRPHVPASSFIDFATGSWSPIVTPKRAVATLRRLENGRRRFGERFLAPYYGRGSGATGRDLARPVGTITTVDRWAVIDGQRMRMMLSTEARDAMGFRRDYVLPKDHKLAMLGLGNAVAPRQAQDYIEALRSAL
ncbi:MAG: DNA cytosine methyltransferase [Ramlibacter sp.]|nr:DNA cytosine methyltransferase [Ramlibacter sp.]